MGFANVIKALSLREMEVAYRPPQVYVNGNTTIFVIRNGVVNIYGIVGYLDTVVATAITMAITVNAVQMDNATPTAVNGAQYDLIMWPMVIGALNVVVPALAAQQLRTDRWVTPGVVGNVTGPCNVVLNCTTGPMVAPESISFRLLYHRLEPRATVTTI